MAAQMGRWTDGHCSIVDGRTGGSLRLMEMTVVDAEDGLVWSGLVFWGLGWVSISDSDLPTEIITFPEWPSLLLRHTRILFLLLYSLSLTQSTAYPHTHESQKEQADEEEGASFPRNEFQSHLNYKMAFSELSSYPYYTFIIPSASQKAIPQTMRQNPPTTPLTHKHKDTHTKEKSSE